jgi:hypothetical protein
MTVVRKERVMEKSRKQKKGFERRTEVTRRRKE